MFCEANTIENIIKVKEQNPQSSIKNIVTFDNRDQLKEGILKRAEEANLIIFEFGEVLQEGKRVGSSQKLEEP